jgi:hypothetical protein
MGATSKALHDFLRDETILKSSREHNIVLDILFDDLGYSVNKAFAALQPEHPCSRLLLFVLPRVLSKIHTRDHDKPLDREQEDRTRKAG